MIVEPTPSNIAHAAEILHGGGLVAFPTETVYGLGANALDATAIAKIYAAKERPSYNPLIVHVSDIESAQRVVQEWPEQAQQLAKRFWPGPLTLVLPKKPDIPDLVTAGLSSVAVRVPAHPVAQSLLKACGLPLAAPSANRFTQISPTTAEHVQKSLGDSATPVDLILSGGATPVGIESTVLSLTEAVPVLLRPGTITREEIEAVIGPITELNMSEPELSGTTPRSAPGLVERHYAPNAETYRFEVNEQENAQERAEHAVLGGQTVGALLLMPSALRTTVPHATLMPSTPMAYAQHLYAALHELEDAGCELIFIEMPPHESAWNGVRDRLMRATSPL